LELGLRRNCQFQRANVRTAYSINPFDSRFRFFPNELPYLLQCQRQIIFLQKKSSLDAFGLKAQML
jgi:hypothetical protein